MDQGKDDEAVMRVGLTGGIASGKTTVAQRFAELGVPVIDADVAAREVVTPGSEGLAAVIQAFGEGILAEDGTLDRGALRVAVFTSPEKRRRLEDLLHPRIRQWMADRAAEAGGPYQLLVIPLLAETARRVSVDRVLVVDVDRETRLKRLKARDGTTPSEAEAIFEAQAGDAERLALAHDVIGNAGPPEALEPRVRRLHAFYEEIAADGRYDAPGLRLA